MERTVIPLWTTRKPYSSQDDGLLTEHLLPAMEDNIDRYTDVTEPTLSFFPACGQGPHPAMLVCPGGAYHHLAWSQEGLDTASFLNIHGFSAFVLKYRCPDRRQAAFADAARAMRLIRFNKTAFQIAPQRVGAIGFSAGAHLTAMLAASAETVPYAENDDIDQLPFRPNFCALIYPGMLADENLQIAPEFKIDSSLPPTLLIHAQDDPVTTCCRSIAWFLALQKAGVPTELHIWPTGGHGFGFIHNNNDADKWADTAAAWLQKMKSRQ